MFGFCLKQIYEFYSAKYDIFKFNFVFWLYFHIDRYLLMLDSYTTRGFQGVKTPEIIL